MYLTTLHKTQRSSWETDNHSPHRKWSAISGIRRFITVTTKTHQRNGIHSIPQNPYLPLGLSHCLLPSWLSGKSFDCFSQSSHVCYMSCPSRPLFYLLRRKCQAVTCPLNSSRSPTMKIKRKTNTLHSGVKTQKSALRKECTIQTRHSFPQDHIHTAR